MKLSSLTEALFGISSDVEVYSEITRGFIERGEYGIAAFRRYLRELGFSDAKAEEILLEIYREVKKKSLEDPEYEELLAAVCSEIGAFYLDLGYDGAEKFLLEAFNLRSKLYGTERVSLLANTMNRLGIFYTQNGKLEKAEVMFEDAYAILKELYERDEEYELDYALATVNLGTFYYEGYRPEEALKYFEEALEHIDVLPCKGAMVYFNMALAYEDLEEYDEALMCLSMSLAAERIHKLGFVSVNEIHEAVNRIREKSTIGGEIRGRK